MLEVVDAPVVHAAGILDRAADQPGFRGQADGQRRIFRRIAEAVLQVGRHRQIGGLHDGACMGQRLVARELAVAPAQHAGRGAAGGGQRGEAHLGQKARAAGVPGVGDDEAAFAVQVAEGFGLGVLSGGHGVCLLAPQA